MRVYSLGYNEKLMEKLTRPLDKSQSNHKEIFDYIGGPDKKSQCSFVFYDESEKDYNFDVKFEAFSLHPNLVKPRVKLLAQYLNRDVENCERPAFIIIDDYRSSKKDSKRKRHYVICRC